MPPKRRNSTSSCSTGSSSDESAVSQIQSIPSGIGMISLRPPPPPAPSGRGRPTKATATRLISVAPAATTVGTGSQALTSISAAHGADYSLLDAAFVQALAATRASHAVDAAVPSASTTTASTNTTSAPRRTRRTPRRSQAQPDVNDVNQVRAILARIIDVNSWANITAPATIRNQVIRQMTILLDNVPEASRLEPLLTPTDARRDIGIILDILSRQARETLLDLVAPGGL